MGLLASLPTPSVMCDGVGLQTRGGEARQAADKAGSRDQGLGTQSGVPRHGGGDPGLGLVEQAKQAQRNRYP